MNFTAACSTLGSPFRTHQTSPPSGTTGLEPSFGTGIVTIPKSTPLFFTFASCQGPITMVAARPLINSFGTSPWFQLTTSLEAKPFLTQSTQSCSATWASFEVRSLKLPPLLQRNGSHCQVACSSFTAEKEIPYTGLFVVLLAASVSCSQVWGGEATPPSVRIFLL